MNSFASFAQSVLLAQRMPDPDMQELPIAYLAFVGTISLVVMAVVIAGMWKVFEKAGEPGWAAIVPFYNAVVMLRIAGLPLWWLILFFIPCVNLVPGIMVPLKIGEKFGKDAAFSILLLAFFPMIGYPLLGFSDAKYQGGPSVPQRY